MACIERINHVGRCLRHAACIVLLVTITSAGAQTSAGKQGDSHRDQALEAAAPPVSAAPTVAQGAALKPGDRRPDFKLRDLAGRYRDVAEWDGKLLLVNFWATWCPPCLHEIPEFIRLQAEHQADGVQFLGVALDNPRDVQRFVDQVGMNYPTLYGAQEAADLAKRYGNPYGGLPYTVVIGRDGVVLHTHPGVLQRDQAKRLIRGAP